MMFYILLLLLLPTSVQGGLAARAAIKHHHRASQRRRCHHREEHNSMKQAVKTVTKTVVKVKTVVNTVYVEKEPKTVEVAEFWDAVPLQCKTLSRDFRAGSATDCKSKCEDDDECEVWQWYDDGTCWRGASLYCAGTEKNVLQGARLRMYAWQYIGSQCRGLTHDEAGDGDLETCQNNCISDTHCTTYQLYTNGQCYRGTPSDCTSQHDLQVEYDGQKAFKFDWKPLMHECTGLGHVSTGEGWAACQSACADDDSCHVYQYFKNEECWKGNANECYSGSEHHGEVLNGGYKWYVTNREGMSACPWSKPHAYRPKHGYDYCCATDTDLNGKKWSDGGDRESCQGNQYTKCQAGNGCTDYAIACPESHPYAYRPDNNYDYCCESDSDQHGTPWARGGDTESCYRQQYTPCPGGSGCADNGICSDDQCCNKKGDTYCRMYRDSCASDPTVREQCAKTCNSGPCSEPVCTDCSCNVWDGSNYQDCRPITTTAPCTGYCVKCQKDGITPMPGIYDDNLMATQCNAYKSRAKNVCVDCTCKTFDGTNYGTCSPITDERPCTDYCVKCKDDGVTYIPTSECEAYENQKL